MSRPVQKAAPLETYAWLALLVCVAITPLAIGKLPWSPFPFTYDPIAYPQSVTLVMGAAVALALWAAAVWARRLTPLVSRPMMPFAAFALWAVAATITAYDPLRALLGGSLSAISLVQIVAYCTIAFLAVQLAGSAGRMRVLAWTVVASSTAVALTALPGQMFAINILGMPSIEFWMLDRGFSTIGNPDHLGTFLVLPVVLSAFLLLVEESTKWRVAAGACLVVLLTVLTATLTRGAGIAVLAGAALAVALLWRTRHAGPEWRKRQAIVAAVCIAAIALALGTRYYPQLLTRVTTPASVPTSGSALDTVNALSSDRISLWRSSLSIVTEHPLTGTGPGLFDLGWYPNAIRYTSAGGAGALADDPHSLPMYVLATTGIPGLALYLVGVAWALVLGARNALMLTRKGALSGTGAQYTAWFVAAAAMQIALLVAAVSAPLIMLGFLSLGVMLRPSARALADAVAAGRWIAAGASAVLAAALFVAVIPNLLAETAMAGVLRSGSVDDARAAAASVPWNIDIQRAYYHLRVTWLNRSLTAQAPGAREDMDRLVADLVESGDAHRRELYYPSVRTQVLTQAAGRFGDTSLDRAAVQAADDALAIMPSHIPTLVNKALALSNLKRYDDMARTLAPYWANETGSAYPGILYAQALALTGKAEEAEDVFQRLLQRFPGERDSIEAARQQAATRESK